MAELSSKRRCSRSSSRRLEFGGCLAELVCIEARPQIRAQRRPLSQLGEERLKAEVAVRFGKRSLAGRIPRPVQPLVLFENDPGRLGQRGIIGLVLDKFQGGLLVGQKHLSLLGLFRGMDLRGAVVQVACELICGLADQLGQLRQRIHRVAEQPQQPVVFKQRAQLRAVFFEPTPGQTSAGQDTVRPFAAEEPREERLETGRFRLLRGR